MVVGTGNLAASIESSERTPNVDRSIGETDQFSHVVVEAMAEASGVEVHEISPIYETIDADALDDLFGCRHDGTLRTGGRVAFDHGECEIVVEPGRVLIFCD
jgi:hypothetical protein